MRVFFLRYTKRKSFQRHHLIIYVCFLEKSNFFVSTVCQRYTRYIIINDTLSHSPAFKLSFVLLVVFLYILLNQFEFNLELSALKENCSLEFRAIYCSLLSLSPPLNRFGCPKQITAFIFWLILLLLPKNSHNLKFDKVLRSVTAMHNLKKKRIKNF